MLFFWNKIKNHYLYEHATAYFRHMRNNCASYTEGVRVFDNYLIRVFNLC